MLDYAEILKLFREHLKAHPEHEYQGYSKIMLDIKIGRLVTSKKDGI